MVILQLQNIKNKIVLIFYMDSYNSSYIMSILFVRQSII